MIVYIVMILTIAIGGVWGSMILAAVLRRLAPRREGAPDPRIDELQVDYRQLEARLEQLEEEASFLRELRGPESPAKLAAPNDDVVQEGVGSEPPLSGLAPKGELKTVGQRQRAFR